MKTTLALLACLLASDAFSQSEIIPSATAPSLAVDKDGKFWCAFVRQGNVMMFSSVDGKTWGDQQIVANSNGRAPGAKQRGPRLGLSDDGMVYVSAPLFLEKIAASERNVKCELYLVVSRDGKSYDTPLLVNEIKEAAAESLHAMAVAPDGSVHLVWLDNREGKGNCLFYAKHSGGKLGRNVRITNAVCPCCAPGITVDGRGNPVVLYREMADDASREIFMTTSRDLGKSWSTPARFNKKDSLIPD
ncbi:MAG: exo-alpha-sialidase [Planctomycetes bacterium]|nr:exo-alpha-sialidase [Planctomycetota bacterium]